MSDNEIDRLRGVVRWPEADEIMQMAFEEGQPVDDASGYYFELEEFDLFVQRLMEEVARLNSPPASAGGVDERAAFEAFVKRAWPTLPLHRRDALPKEDRRYGEYVHLENEWITWQSRASLSAPSDQYRDLVWMAHQLADMVLKGDAPHTAVRVAKSLIRECEGKQSEPSHCEQVREGWKPVPVEPTSEMLDAARRAPIPAVYLDSLSAMADLSTKARYCAMLAAAPSAGSQGGDV